MFSCDKVDDLGVALTGLHPGDVWVMRFDANLPKDALTADLTIEPLASDQTPVQSHLVASKSVNDACSSGAMASIVPARPPLRGTGFTALVLGLGVALARRLARTRKAPST